MATISEEQSNWPRTDSRESVPLFIRAISQWWLVLVVLAALCGAAAAWWTWVSPDAYEASATVAVSSTSRESNANLQALGSVRALLASSVVGEAVVARFRLREPPHSLTLDELVRRRLRMTQVGETNTLSVRLRLSSPTLAADALTHLIATAIEENRRLADVKVATVVSPFTARLEEARQQVQHAADGLLQFKKAAGMEQLRVDTEIALKRRSRLAELEAAIAAERSRIADAEKELAVRQAQPRVGPDSTSGPPPVREISPNRAEAGPTEDGRLTALAFSSVAEMLDYEIATGRTRVSALEAERAALSAKTSRDPFAMLYATELEFGSLEMDYRSAASQYQALRDRVATLRQDVLDRTPIFDITAPATAPESPVSPPVWLSAIAGAAVGVLVGLLGLISLMGWNVYRAGERA
jgi:uncharacterized protein involved in exopolysaccharide biosynthesis